MKNKRFALSKRDLDFIDKSIEISDVPASIEHATFMFLPFCQLGFPRSLHDDISFSRSCGAIQLKVCDGTNGTVSKTPFGPASRLILAYICSHAVRFKTSKIELGNSAAEFMRRIGLASTGGKKGSLTSVKLQLLNIYRNYSPPSITLCINSGQTPLNKQSKASPAPTLCLRQVDK